MPEAPRGLGQEAIEAARAKQERRMNRRKTTGLVAALFSLPLMLAIGFVLGWGFFPPQAATIEELAGTMMVAERCVPVVNVQSYDASQLPRQVKKLDTVIAAWKATPGVRYANYTVFQGLVEGRIIILVYAETCDTTPEQPQEVPTP